jgi:hypothetical protein
MDAVLYQYRLAKGITGKWLSAKSIILAYPEAPIIQTITYQEVLTDQHGVVKYANDNNKLYNLRMNYDLNLTKRLRLETKVSYENQHRSDIAGVGNWVIGEAIFGMPKSPGLCSRW